jgi:hypothetical protein
MPPPLPVPPPLDVQHEPEITSPSIAAAASSISIPHTPLDLAASDDVSSFRPGRKRVRVALAGAALLGAVFLWLGVHAKSTQPLAENANATARAQLAAARAEATKELPPAGDSLAHPVATSNTAAADPSEPARANTPAATPPTTTTIVSPEAPSDTPPAEHATSEPRSSKKTASATAARSAAPIVPKAEKPIETELPDPAAPPARGAKSTVDDEALQQALGQAAQRAKGCHVEGGPTGTVRVSVTFAPSGDVTGAAVQGAAFKDTVEGECIAAKFRALHIPAFSGNDFLARKSVTIE